MVKDKIIIVGKSASGKDYLIDYLMDNGFNRSVSYTSRPMRGGEKDGITYNFISKSKFEDMIESGYFLEHHNFNGWYYGNTVGDFNTNDVFIKTALGIEKIKPYRDRILIIYLDINIDIRRERLYNRKDSNDSIERRIKADEKDFENFADYDIRITDPNYDINELYDYVKTYDNLII